MTDSWRSYDALPLFSPTAVARRTDPATSHATAMLAGGVRGERGCQITPRQSR